jgi:hypothetical protein
MLLGIMAEGRTNGSHSRATLRNSSQQRVSRTANTPGVTKRPVAEKLKAYYGNNFGGSSTGNSFNIGLGGPFGAIDVGFSNFDSNYVAPAYYPEPYYGGGLGYGYGYPGYGYGYGMGYPYMYPYMMDPWMMMNPWMMNPWMGGWGYPWMMGGMGGMGMGGFGMPGMGMGGFGMGGFGMPGMGMGMGGFGMPGMGMGMGGFGGGYGMGGFGF